MSEPIPADDIIETLRAGADPMTRSEICSALDLDPATPISRKRKKPSKPKRPTRASRLEAVRKLLESGPKTTKEIANATSASAPSARAWAHAIGAVPVGSHPARWTLPDAAAKAAPNAATNAANAASAAPAPRPATEPPAPVDPPSAAPNADDAVQVLCGVEWGGVWRDGADENSACPECEGIQPGQGYDGADGHATGCRLAAVLAGHALPPHTLEAQLRDHLIGVLGGEGDTALPSLVKEAARTILHYEGLLNTLAAVANVHDETSERYEAALSRAQAALNAARKGFWPAMPTEAAVSLMAATGKIDINAACEDAACQIVALKKRRAEGSAAADVEAILGFWGSPDETDAVKAVAELVKRKDAVIETQRRDLETAERRISDLIAREHSGHTFLLDRVARMARHDARKALDGHLSRWRMADTTRSQTAFGKALQDHLFKCAKVGKTHFPTPSPDASPAAAEAEQ